MKLTIKNHRKLKSLYRTSLLLFIIPEVLNGTLSVNITQAWSIRIRALHFIFLYYGHGWFSIEWLVIKFSDKKSVFSLKMAIFADSSTWKTSFNHLNPGFGFRQIQSKKKYTDVKSQRAKKAIL